MDEIDILKSLNSVTGKTFQDKDIVIEVNDDWKNTPFQIKGNCVVLENVCISSKSDKKKWILLDVLPLFLITLFIFVIVYFAIIIGMIFVQESERRIPIQYANKSTSAYGNAQSFMPIKLL